MTDLFAAGTDAVFAPATHAVAIQPDDRADLPDTPKGLYVGTSGDVALIGARAPGGAAASVFRNVPAGSVLPVRARRVLATGTTAGAIVALL